MIGGLHRRPILLAAAGAGVVIAVAARLTGVALSNAALLGWCAAVLCHAVPTLSLMRRATPESIRRRAEALDEGEAAVLGASLTASIAALGAVVWTLAAARGAPGHGQTELAVAAIALSWGFVHLLFAVRYAHEYWQAGSGLEFGGTEAPRFDDFLYFAFTIGMTFQTSDTVVVSSALRQLVLLHGLVAFLFNVVILAAAVNLAAGLVG